MLKKANRLTKSKEIAEVLKKGKAAYWPILMVKFLKNDLPYSRYAIIVSNKVSKRANKRNLIKRRIREIMRLAMSQVKKGYDAVIIASPKIINKQGKVIKYQELEKFLKTVLVKANLLWINCLKA